MRRALAGRVAIHAEAGVGPQPRLGAPDAPASGMESMTRDDVESTSGGTTNGTCNDPVNSGDRMRPCRGGRAGRGGRGGRGGAGVERVGPAGAAPPAWPWVPGSSGRTPRDATCKGRCRSARSRARRRGTRRRRRARGGAPAPRRSYPPPRSRPAESRCAPRSRAPGPIHQRAPTTTSPLSEVLPSKLVMVPAPAPLHALGTPTLVNAGT